MNLNSPEIKINTISKITTITKQWIYLLITLKAELFSFLSFYKDYK